MKKENKIDEELEDELNRQFPKGDKARGRASLLFALAQIKINKFEIKKSLVLSEDHTEH